MGGNVGDAGDKRQGKSGLFLQKRDKLSAQRMCGEYCVRLFFAEQRRKPVQKKIMKGRPRIGVSEGRKPVVEVKQCARMCDEQAEASIHKPGERRQGVIDKIHNLR